MLKPISLSLRIAAAFVLASSSFFAQVFLMYFCSYTMCLLKPTTVRSQEFWLGVLLTLNIVLAIEFVTRWPKVCDWLEQVALSLLKEKATDYRSPESPPASPSDPPPDLS